jgi:FkbM family methyltransferase
VWAGRYGQQLRGALDGWNCSRSRLASILEEAGELVVLDALSFPWELLHADNRDIPIDVALPANLDAGEIGTVLGRPLLGALTPFDRLIESRPEVRSALQQRWGLCEATWISVPDASIESVLAALSDRSASRLIDVVTDFGIFRGQRDDVVTRHLQDYGAHQRGTLNVLFAVIREDDVVVDVGAHIGAIAIPLAARLADRGHVFAVEGSASTARLLRLNVVANRMEERVTVIERVVGRTAGRRLRARYVDGNTGATDFIESGWADVEGLECTTLDALCEEHSDLGGVTVLKLDVEGADLAVLEGAAGLIARRRPLIVCEVSPSQLERHGATIDELDTWLAEAGYRLELVAGPRNSTESTWQLTALRRLSESTELHFDVLAIPAESDRTAQLGHEGVV